MAGTFINRDRDCRVGANRGRDCLRRLHRIITKSAIGCSSLLLYIGTLNNTQFENFNVFANIYTCFPPLFMTGAVGPMTLTLPSTSAGPGPTSAALKFYIYSAEIAIPPRLMLIPVFHTGELPMQIVA